MTRTVVVLSDDMKAWLVDYSESSEQSLDDTIAVALREFREKKEAQRKKDIIRKTAGIWKSRRINGLDYVRGLRNKEE